MLGGDEECLLEVEKRKMNADTQDFHSPTPRIYRLDYFF